MVTTIRFDFRSTAIVVGLAFAWTVAKWLCC